MNRNSYQGHRTQFAQELTVDCKNIRDALRLAFATVRREDFLSAPPWTIPSLADGNTTSSDPADLYKDVLVALDSDRGLNNGAPSLWVTAFDELRITEGERVTHIGCGSGYYSAILASLVGSEGSVNAVEVDLDLATMALHNLANRPQVEVSAASGLDFPTTETDVIVVSAGATAVPDRWLDHLSVGGRLYFPLTTIGGEPKAQSEAVGFGGAFVVERVSEDDYSARFSNPIGIFHCVGARTAEGNDAVCEAFSAGPDAFEAVRSLRREKHLKSSECWLHTDSACFSSAPARQLGT